MESAQNIDTIGVGLTLDTSSFDAGLKKAQTSLAAFERSRTASLRAPQSMALSPQFKVTQAQVRGLRVDINQHMSAMAARNEAVAVPVKLGASDWAGMRQQISQKIGNVPITVTIAGGGNIRGQAKTAVQGSTAQVMGGSVDMASIISFLAQSQGASNVDMGRRIRAAAASKGVVGKARGGPVVQDRDYLVGEDGPEIFRPSAPGRIIPAYRGKKVRGYGAKYGDHKPRFVSVSDRETWSSIDGGEPGRYAFHATNAMQSRGYIPWSQADKEKYADRSRVALRGMGDIRGGGPFGKGIRPYTSNWPNDHRSQAIMERRRGTDYSGWDAEMADAIRQMDKWADWRGPASPHVSFWGTHAKGAEGYGSYLLRTKRTPDFSESFDYQYPGGPMLVTDQPKPPQSLQYLSYDGWKKFRRGRARVRGGGVRGYGGKYGAAKPGDPLRIGPTQPGYNYHSTPAIDAIRRSDGVRPTEPDWTPWGRPGGVPEGMSSPLASYWVNGDDRMWASVIDSDMRYRGASSPDQSLWRNFWEANAYGPAAMRTRSSSAFSSSSAIAATQRTVPRRDLQYWGDDDAWHKFRRGRRRELGGADRSLFERIRSEFPIAQARMEDLDDIPVPRDMLRIIRGGRRHQPNDTAPLIQHPASSGVYGPGIYAGLDTPFNPHGSRPMSGDGVPIARLIAAEYAQTAWYQGGVKGDPGQVQTGLVPRDEMAFLGDIGLPGLTPQYERWLRLRQKSYRSGNWERESIDLALERLHSDQFAGQLGFFDEDMSRSFRRSMQRRGFKGGVFDYRVADPIRYEDPTTALVWDPKIVRPEVFSVTDFPQYGRGGAMRRDGGGKTVLHPLYGSGYTRERARMFLSGDLSLERLIGIDPQSGMATRTATSFNAGSVDMPFDIGSLFRGEDVMHNHPDERGLRDLGYGLPLPSPGDFNQSVQHAWNQGEIYQRGGGHSRWRDLNQLRRNSSAHAAVTNAVYKDLGARSRNIVDPSEALDAMITGRTMMPSGGLAMPFGLFFPKKDYLKATTGEDPGAYWGRLFRDTFAKHGFEIESDFARGGFMGGASTGTKVPSFGKRLPSTWTAYGHDISSGPVKKILGNYQRMGEIAASDPLARFAGNIWYQGRRRSLLDDADAAGALPRGGGFGPFLNAARSIIPVAAAASPGIGDEMAVRWAREIAKLTANQQKMQQLVLFAQQDPRAAAVMAERLSKTKRTDVPQELLALNATVPGLGVGRSGWDGLIKAWQIARGQLNWRQAFATSPKVGPFARNTYGNEHLRTIDSHDLEIAGIADDEVEKYRNMLVRGRPSAPRAHLLEAARLAQEQYADIWPTTRRHQAGLWVPHFPIGRGKQPVDAALTGIVTPKGWRGQEPAGWMSDPATGLFQRRMAGGPLFRKVAPETFAEAITAARKKEYTDPQGRTRSIGETVYQYPDEEYGAMRTYLDRERSAGYAIKDDGDFVSVFNAGERGKGRGKSIVRSAIQRGATKLDAYDEDGFLPRLYSKYGGFREVGRDKWDERYKPEGWRGGTPDVVYMRRFPKRGDGGRTRPSDNTQGGYMGQSQDWYRDLYGGPRTGRDYVGRGRLARDFVGTDTMGDFIARSGLADSAQMQMWIEATGHDTAMGAPRVGIPWMQNTATVKAVAESISLMRRIKTPKAHATGGREAGAQTYLVGELQPELFIPDRMRYIIPPDVMDKLPKREQGGATRKMGSSGVVEVGTRGPHLFTPPEDGWIIPHTLVGRVNPNIPRVHAGGRAHQHNPDGTHPARKDYKPSRDQYAQFFEYRDTALEESRAGRAGLLQQLSGRNPSSIVVGAASNLFGGRRQAIEAASQLALAERRLVRYSNEYANDILEAGNLQADVNKLNAEQSARLSKLLPVLEEYQSQTKEVARLTKEASPRIGAMLRNAAASFAGFAAYSIAMEGFSTLMSAVGPAVSQIAGQAMGFAPTSQRVTKSLSEDSIAKGGRTEAVIAEASLGAGLSGAAVEYLDRQLGASITAKGGAQVAGNANQLWLAAIGAQNGAETGLLGGYGGIGGGGFLAQQFGGGMGFAETIAQGMAASQGQALTPTPDNPGIAWIQKQVENLGTGIDVLVNSDQYAVNPNLGAGTILTKTVAVDNSQRDLMAEELGKALDRGVKFRNQDAGGAQVSRLTSEQQQQIASSDLDDYTKQMAAAGVGFTDAAGNVITATKDVEKAWNAAAAGIQVPDPETYAKAQAQSLRSAAQASEASRQFGTTMALGGLGIDLLASPMLPAGAGVLPTSDVSSGASKGVQATLEANIAARQEQQIGIQTEYNRYLDGLRKEVAEYTPGLMTEFNGLVKGISDVGSAIAFQEERIANIQTNASAMSFANNLRLATRALKDAQNLAGGNQAGGRLGTIQREQFFLQRELQKIGFMLEQRQINFSVAQAGFIAPGISGEERAGRQDEARIEAGYRQQQLDINMELFGLGFQEFNENVKRAVEDAKASLGVIQANRDAELEIADANRQIALEAKRMAPLQARLSKILEKTQTDFSSRLSSAAGYVSTFGGTIKEATSAIARAFQVPDPYARRRRQVASATNRGTEATGFSGYVNTPTSFVAGEAAGEQVLVLRNPRSGVMAMGGGDAPSGGTNVYISIGNIGSRDDLPEVERRLTRAVKEALGREANLLGIR